MTRAALLASAAPRAMIAPGRIAPLPVDEISRRLPIIEKMSSAIPTGFDLSRLIFTTGNPWVVPDGFCDRRFLILEQSPREFVSWSPRRGGKSTIQQMEFVTRMLEPSDRWPA
ncbi:MAG: hypothetical protein HQL42_13230 [Alphaproteobacteria bacterium]|nr:hypothetical protein [Alphaproteobacteria bacterium]